MKKIFLFLSVLILFTGCIKRDAYEDITIYTSCYPIYYITNELYGNNSHVYSIYPNESDVETYELNSKQIKDYSKGSIFVFNSSIENENKYVIEMFNYNKKLKIIDSNLSMDYEYDISELWLNPSNFLMMSSNVKNGLENYITNRYVINEIDENYKELNLKISTLDANFKSISESSSNNTIIVTNNMYKFLEKYKFNVISLDPTTATEKTYNEALELITSGNISYIFTKENEELSETLNEFISSNKLQVLSFRTLATLNDDEEKENENYFTIMNDNLEKLKLEVYD
jgi:zinc transport system substrate-binding protein